MPAGTRRSCARPFRRADAQLTLAICSLKLHRHWGLRCRRRFYPLSYDEVTRADSRYPVAPYCERRTVIPSVFHQGNRGLTRDRILQEGELFLATRVELAQRAEPLLRHAGAADSHEVARRAAAEISLA